MGDYNIKIYATDIDEEAPGMSRDAENRSAGAIAPGSPSTCGEKYFTGRGSTSYGSDRDIRRLTIFGRSNIVADAPICHCNLVVLPRVTS